MKLESFTNPTDLFSIRARLAQSVERWTFNPTVVGSSPTSGEIFDFALKFCPKIYLETVFRMLHQ